MPGTMEAPGIPERHMCATTQHPVPPPGGREAEHAQSKAAGGRSDECSVGDSKKRQRGQYAEMRKEKGV